MKRSEELYDRIERFLSNTLSESERIRFEKELDTNSELQREVERHKMLKDILQHKKVVSFKRDLKSIGKEIEVENRKVKKNTYRYIGIAATIAVLLSIGGLWLTGSNNANQTDALYSEYFSPFPIVKEVRSGASKSLETVRSAYHKKYYNQVINESLTISDSLFTDEVKLYLGNSYLSVDQEKKAVSFFKGIPYKSGYYEDAQWYLSLAYLKIGDIQHTTRYLENLILYDGRYQKKATELHKKIVALKK